MAKRNQLTPLPFKGLTSAVYPEANPPIVSLLTVTERSVIYSILPEILLRSNRYEILDPQRNKAATTVNFR